LGHALWQQRFGSNSGIVGSTLRLNGRPFTVVGVMPPGFSYPRGAELWTSLMPELERFTIPGKLDALEARHYGMLYVVGRLRPSIALDEAHAELDAIVRGLPEFEQRMSAAEAVVVLTPFLDHVFGQTRRALLLLLGMVGLVLATACANVSSLLLTRATARRRDTAVKVALGASRARLLREWLAETVIVACAATLSGLFIAHVGLRIILRLAPPGLPRLDDAAIDSRIAAFSVGVAVVVAVVCAIAPAWHSARRSLTERLKETRLAEGRDSRRSRRLLIGAQLAIATALLMGAGLLVNSFAAVRQLELGFDPDRVLTLTVEPQVDGNARYRAVYESILRRVAVVPEVQALGAVYLRPLAHGPIGMDNGALIDGQHINQPETWRDNPTLNFQSVTPGYFAAMRIPLMNGRMFSEADDERAPGAVIVSESAARRLWPGENPVGKRISLAGGRTEDGRFPWQTVVGVVADVRYRGLDDVRFDVYMPATQTLNRVKHLMVRTSAEPLSAVAAIRAAISEVAGRVVVEHVATMEDVVDDAVAPWRFTMTIFVVLAGIGVALATVGLFGLVTYSVSHRTPELALRLAIGARPSQLLRMVLWEGGRLVLAGIAMGVAASVVFTQMLAGLLFRVEPNDPRTFGVVVALLGLITLLACYVAARRAMMVDAMVVLRND
jgi:putative ABC transport system permease protein